MVFSVFKTMAQNIAKTDWIVFTGLIFTLPSFFSISRIRKKLRRKYKKMPDNPDWAEDLRVDLNRAYSVFTSSITLYPLLGMFGTVISLISVGDVDFSQAAESLNAIKGDFFTALTSTAWGIVFAAVFKVVNSFVQPKVEDDMKIITSLVDDLKKKNNTKYLLWGIIWTKKIFSLILHHYLTLRSLLFSFS